MDYKNRDQTSMETVIIDPVEYEIDLARLMKAAHVKEDQPYSKELVKLAESAREAARPRVIYGVAYVEQRDDDSVVIAGTRFHSRVLRVNLDSAHRVFPLVATCGDELEQWAAAITDPLHKFWADTVKLQALQATRDAIRRHISERYHPGKKAFMSPGSLEDWPIEQQKPLFELLGDVHGAVGVTLRDNCFMAPTATVSGILFPTEESFESCMLCPREKCPGRRAKYDKNLYDEKFRL